MDRKVIDIEVLREAISKAKAEILVRNCLNKADRKTIKKWEKRIQDLTNSNK